MDTSKWNMCKLFTDGYSDDIKYEVKDNENNHYLIRITPKESYQQKLEDFNDIKKNGTIKDSYSRSYSMLFGR